jgi:hypothetical protein
MYQLTSLEIAVLAPAARVAADGNSTGIDLSGLTGNAYFLLNASATEGAGQTADLKLQHADTQGGAYTDAGISFAQVTNAVASAQKVMASTDGLKKFVRVAHDLTGAGAAVTYGVTVIGKKAP